MVLTVMLCVHVGAVFHSLVVFLNLPWSQESFFFLIAGFILSLATLTSSVRPHQGNFERICFFLFDHRETLCPFCCGQILVCRHCLRVGKENENSQDATPVFINTSGLSSSSASSSAFRYGTFSRSASFCAAAPAPLPDFHPPLLSSTPVRVQCFRCSGSGQRLELRSVDCSLCHGSGTSNFHERCTNCLGSGVYTGLTSYSCTLCGGSGKGPLEKCISCTSGSKQESVLVTCDSCSGRGFTYENH